MTRLNFIFGILIAALSLVGEGRARAEDDAVAQGSPPARFVPAGQSVAEIPGETFFLRYRYQNLGSPDVHLRRELWSSSTVNGSAHLDLRSVHPTDLKSSQGALWSELVDGRGLGFSLPILRDSRTGRNVAFGRTLLAFVTDPEGQVTQGAVTEIPKVESEIHQKNVSVAHQAFESLVFMPFLSLSPILESERLRVYHFTLPVSDQGRAGSTLLRDFLLVFVMDDDGRVEVALAERARFDDITLRAFEPGERTLQVEAGWTSARLVPSGKTENRCVSKGFGGNLGSTDLDDYTCDVFEMQHHHYVVPDTLRVKKTSGGTVLDFGSGVRLVEQLFEEIHLYEWEGLLAEGVDRETRFRELSAKNARAPREMSLGLSDDALRSSLAEERGRMRRMSVFNQLLLTDTGGAALARDVLVRELF